MTENMRVKRKTVKKLYKHLKKENIKKISLKDMIDIIEQLQNKKKPVSDAKDVAPAEIKTETSKKDYTFLKGENIEKEWAIYEVHKATGWNRDKIIAEFKKYKKNYDISRKKYCRLKIYNIEPENFKSVYAERLKIYEEEKALRKQKRADASKSNRAEALEKVMKKTGWSMEEALEKMKRDKKLYDCREDLYYYFRFYEIPEEKKSTYLTQSLSGKVSEKYDTSKFFVSLLSDKERTNYFFADIIRRPWCVNTRVTKEEFKEVFKNTEKLFYKPLHDHQGNGAEKIDLEKENIEGVYDRLKNYAEGVVEGFVKQHPVMNKLSPTVVNTLRIVSISSDTQYVGEPGKSKDIAYVSVKMGGRTGCVDNLAGGGMVAAVDIKTGKIITNAIDEQDNIFDIHPVTGTVIKGFEIPYYKEAIQMVYDSIDKYHLNGYLGWDIAIAEDGPELVETNVGPGVILHQLPFSAEGIGVKNSLEKYL